MTGNGDIHRLRQLGTTYSLVDAEPHADAICAAVRAGRVQVEATPRSLAVRREPHGGSDRQRDSAAGLLAGDGRGAAFAVARRTRR